jgi:hypothetical protein
MGGTNRLWPKYDDLEAGLPSPRNRKRLDSPPRFRRIGFRPGLPSRELTSGQGLGTDRAWGQGIVYHPAPFRPGWESPDFGASDGELMGVKGTGR